MAVGSNRGGGAAFTGSLAFFCMNQIKSIRLDLIELENCDGYKSADCPCAAALC